MVDSKTVPATEQFEKLGAFYLGRPYDPVKKAPQPGLILYDSKDLVTHAVCVGMTGSGKTGLCIDLLEEAALDGVPAIAIDPKGDLTNLMLTFPELRPEDFRPWINEDDARAKSLTPDEYAAHQAKLWRDGLAGWGEDGERIRRLREAADFAIYTPGSSAGIPISILASFEAPAQSVRDDSELLRDRVTTTASSVLGLLGIAADPIQSREHILIANLLTKAWSAGQGLDLGALITQIQKPPMTRVGALDLETFYPAKERAQLAVKMNNLLASPGFNAWLEGVPLDVGQLLRSESGKPRVAIVSIAHLSETERMFFVSLLLNQVLDWARAQSGTTSLRAVLYMDEIFGYFPPVAEPPSKRPLLTLLKQARAFGLGIVLATQNPVDLDYKGLANAGTWFLGRLQTERDKARVLEGLESASAAAHAEFAKGEIDKLLSGLSQRIFLMHNVHEDAPVVFETRWAMSYLRGPLTRDQIKKLMDGKRPTAAAVPRASSGTAGATSDAAAETAQRTREQRDAAVEKLRTQYAPKLRRLQEKVRNAEQVVQREEGQARGAKTQTAISAGATILDALLGRKISRTSMGRATTTARGAQRAMQQEQDVKAAKEDLESAQAEYERLEDELADKIAEIQAQA
jgi:ribosomal protein L12E/L44/L45/RPP1/RPP2